MLSAALPFEVWGSWALEILSDDVSSLVRPFFFPVTKNSLGKNLVSVRTLLSHGPWGYQQINQASGNLLTVISCSNRSEISGPLTLVNPNFFFISAWSLSTPPPKERRQSRRRVDPSLPNFDDEGTESYERQE